MSLPMIKHLNQDDMLNLLKFSSALCDSYDDFINATLRSLDDCFGLSISTYTIFGYDKSGNVRILNNYSNFFTPLDLEFYETEGFKTDASFLNSKIDFARNSGKYAFVTEYSKDSSNPYSLRMRKSGIKYQIRLGAHKRGVTPLHVLSVYLPDNAPPPGEYQMELFSLIGKIFSEHVGNYKRVQLSSMICRFLSRGMETDDAGVALYEPLNNILEYNRIFKQQCNTENIRSVLDNIINEVRSDISINKTVSAMRGSTVFTVQELLDSDMKGISYYVFRTQPADTSSTSANKPLLKPQYLKTGLTFREIEVVSLIEKGFSNQEISDKLVISMSTVKTHVKNIFSKYNVRSRTELIMILQEEEA